MDRSHVQHDGEATREQPSRRIKPIVFASFVGRRPTAALRRAAGLAQRFEVDLHVVLVIPSPSWSRDVDDNVAQASRTIDRLADTMHWCHTILSPPYPTACYARIGAFVSEVADHVRVHGASMIVLPPYEGRSAACVTALATGSRVSVLVARPPTPGSVVLAATDLHDKHYPVLQRAVDLVAALHQPLVAINTLEEGSDARELLQHRTELVAALAPVAPVAPVDVKISATPSPADAILWEARTREADLVVVGAHSRPWFGPDKPRPSTASELLCRAQCSILVTPMEDDN